MQSEWLLITSLICNTFNKTFIKYIYKIYYVLTQNKIDTSIVSSKGK